MLGDGRWSSPEPSAVTMLDAIELVDTHKPNECKVCWQTYRTSSQRPRTLPCGHTYCTSCITELNKDGVVSCPTCRSDHKAANTTQFPINYSVEEMITDTAPAPEIGVRHSQVQSPISNLVGGEVPSPTRATRPCEGRSKELTEHLQQLVKSVKRNIHNIDLQYEETEEQLTKYTAQVDDWLQEHQQLSVKLNKLLEKNNKATELLQSEKEKLKKMTESSETRKEERQTVTKRLTSAISTEEAIAAVDDVEANNVASETWMNNCNQLIPDVKAVYRSHQVRKTTSKGLEVMDSESCEADVIPIPLEASILPIMEKVEKITTNRAAKKTLTAEELRPLGPTVKVLVETGRVVALQNHRCSQVSYYNDSLLLHTLLDKPVPNDVHTTQHSAVMGLLDLESSVTVFLELAWGGSTRGKLFIRLRPFSGLARQFLRLCTGEMGPSYRRSKLLEVGKKGTSWEWVKGGDYEQNNGKGGKKILQELDVDHEKRILSTRGHVLAGSGWTEANSAQFNIRTQDPHITRVDYVFGKVSDGLEILQTAIRDNNNIQDVTVTDCGVVVPL